jgi:membrane-bound ClpP family serine protease
LGKTFSFRTEEEGSMIVLGLICLILGLVLNIGILWTIGLILIAVGIILAILGTMDRAIGPRRHYW